MFFSQKILNWFHIYGRKSLPWHKKNIYQIWISEIMLQQTQVKTVIPYFKKFIKKFPTIKSLASSSINEILHLWSGLGYYQRAHRIHKTAILICKNYHGIFPNNIHEINKLPGIGKSTAGAILSFAYNFGYAVLDGNVKRVLIRYHSIDINNIKKEKLNKKLWNLIYQHLPVHQSSKFNQAMMDIGSFICTSKKPNCLICPLNYSCQYYIHDMHFTKEKTKKKNKIGILFTIIQYKNFYFLIQLKNTSIWKKLFYFPLTSFLISKEKWEQAKKNSNTVIHPFIHYISNIKLHIFTQIIKIKKKKTYNNIIQKKIWYNIFNPQKIGIPSPIRKIFTSLQKPVKKNMKKKYKRIIFCFFLKKEEEGLEYPFFPGKTGQKIYQEISKKAWSFWLIQQTKIINEKKLNMFLEKDRAYIKRKMKKFLFHNKKN
nr:A/G-specific adenine glycosylase [Buchnera aphidicola]